MEIESTSDTLLSRYRVLDLTEYGAMLCGKILGDLGADVIKIEKPGGDLSRKYGPTYKNRLDYPAGLYWWALNVNKRGITLNIESHSGQEIFRRLVKSCDFVIESFSAGYLDGLQLDYNELRQINARIIMTSISPFGQTGPKAHYKACDLVSWASGGQMYCCGDADRPPMQLIFPQAYLHAGAEAAVGSLIAHYYREISGEGQHVDVSIQESVIGTLMDTQEMWDFSKFDFVRSGRYFTFLRTDGTPVRHAFIFPCKDGWVTCYTLGGTAMASVRSLQGIVGWMDEEGAAPEWLKTFDWVNDYQTTSLTQEKIDEVEAPFIRFLKTKTKKELYEAGLRRGLILGPVFAPQDIVESEQLKIRDFWRPVEHRELGESITYCGAWAKFSETSLEIRRRPPLLGEHNQEIYSEDLNMSRLEMLWLRESGII